MKKLLVLLFLLISTSCFAKEYQVVRVFHTDMSTYNSQTWTFLYLDGETMKKKTFLDYDPSFKIVANKNIVGAFDTIDIGKGGVTWNVRIHAH